MTHALNVVRWRDPLKEDVQIDPYVPVKIVWGQWTPDEEYVYWRTGDLETSMVEFRVVKETGELRSVTLLMVSTYREEGLAAPTLPSMPTGLPQFSVDPWRGGRYVDSPGTLLISLFDGRLTMSWSDHSSVRVVRSGGRVWFGLDGDGNLVSLTLFDLSSREISLMRGALDHC